MTVSDDNVCDIYCYYQNVRGLNGKLREFVLNVDASEFDVIALTETWLRDSVFDAEIFNNNYQVFRCDRSSSDSCKSRGGGVLIAVKSKFYSESVVFNDLED